MTRFTLAAFVAACLLLPAALEAQPVVLESGIYSVVGGEYRVVVDMSEGTIRTVEPSGFVSEYTSTAQPNVYHYTSTGERTKGTVYAIQVLSPKGFVTYKPGVNGPGTQQQGTSFTYAEALPAISVGAPATPEAEGRSAALAEKYQKKMEEDPANTHLWATCALAAFTLGHADEAGFAEHAASIVASIKPIMETPDTNPCADVIPDKIWRAN